MAVPAPGKDFPDSMREPKPPWLRTRIPSGDRWVRLRRQLKRRGLSTICQEARCPNLQECWEQNHATFLILGSVCTRDCAFCAVEHGEPEPVDTDESAHISQMMDLLELTYVVITSVTRDDLEDGGSSHFHDILTQLHRSHPEVKVEVLIPDFQGHREALERVLRASPVVLNHNLETVESLYPVIRRSPGQYSCSLELLRRAREAGHITKSGIMVGMGETRDEVLQLFRDLREKDVQLLTIGQYLQPGRRQMPVKRYYRPDEFRGLRETALEMGFRGVESGPFVRSSYHAEQLFNKAGTD